MVSPAQPQIKMHYRNGREAKNGDIIIQLTSSDPAKITHLGVLHNATPGNDFCNGSIAPLLQHSGACMCDCLHVDDVAAILTEKGLGVRSTGK